MYFITFVLRHGTTLYARARNIKPANIDKWEGPNFDAGKKIRKAVYAVPPPDLDSESSSCSSEPSSKTIIEHKKRLRSESKDSSDSSDTDQT